MHVVDAQLDVEADAGPSSQAAVNVDELAGDPPGVVGGQAARWNILNG